MRIGFISQYDRERIAFMKNNGFGCVELFAMPGEPIVPGQDGWQAKAAEARDAYDEAGIRISCLAGFYMNHMDADPKAAQEHAEHVRNVIRLAVEMKVPVVGGFSGRVMGQDLEASIPKFKEIWGEHARFAADHGIKIAFEHCPMGQYHTPYGGINCICTPWMWERCFGEVDSEALGLEWDPSHLVTLLVDPVANIRDWGHKIYHVHAKDAKLYRQVTDKYGLFHDGAVEHCFPGLGDNNWGLLIKELRRVGYHGDLNIEGWHDLVYVDHEKGPQLEDLGLLIAKRHLEPFIDGE